MRGPSVEYRWCATGGLPLARLVQLQGEAVRALQGAYLLPVVQGAEGLPAVSPAVCGAEWPRVQSEPSSVEHCCRQLLQVFLLGHDHVGIPDVMRLLGQYGLEEVLEPETDTGDQGTNASSSQSGKQRRYYEVAAICCGLGVLGRYDSDRRADDGRGGPVSAQSVDPITGTLLPVPEGRSTEGNGKRKAYYYWLPPAPVEVYRHVLSSNN